MSSGVGVQAGVSEARTASASGHDVVFTFYRETWADAQRRGMYMPGDRLVDTLRDNARVRRLVVADPYRSAPVRWIRTLAGARTEPFEATASHVHVQPRRLRREDPTSIRALERLYGAYDKVLARAAARLGADRPLLITTSPFVAGFAPLRWASGVTFYGWDDWASGLPVRHWWPAYEEAYARVRDTGRGVVAVTQAVMDRIRPTGPSAIVPNGVDAAEWLAPAAPPGWFAALPQPRILYVGVLDDRLDTDAVREVARRFPDGTVVLLGPVGDAAAVAPLHHVPNVHVAPPVDRVQVAAVVHAADVCVMPHRRTRMTAAMSPLKLYEYRAGGRPVAATDLPPVRDVDPAIVRVGERDSFADGVAAALAAGPLAERERLAFVDTHSWSRRHEQILDVAVAAAAR